MSARFHLLSTQLLSKTLDQSSIEELQGMVLRYPFFSAAQVVLAKKLKSSGAEDYSLQAQKASLYISQPAAFTTIAAAEELDFSFVWENENPPLRTRMEERGFEKADAPEPILEEDNLHNPSETPKVELQPATLSLITFEETEDTDEDLEEAEETKTIINQQTAKDNYVKEAQQDIATPIPERETKGFEKVLLPNSSTQSALTFEPFHTVDYFASQGIKLSKEEASTDRMGRQLKSFTQWLKTMKRLPEAELVKTLDSNSEQKVESMAAHSVETTNILTETMAEVWAKQGNKEKAIEVYNKLSLLNPYKKAYFAAKVENLKNAF